MMDLKAKILPALAFVLSAGVANATLINNGDFETGDFSGWTQFTFNSGNVIGSTGPTSVSLFDTNNDTVATNSAQFQVGQVSPGPIGGGSPRVGGGIYQSFSSGAGLLSLSFDVAMSPFSRNADGGIVEMLLDGVVLDSVDFSQTINGVKEYDVLLASTLVTAGAHELRIRIARGYGIGNTPAQYIDNVVATLSPATVPEPASLALLGLGLAGIGMTRRMKK